MAKLDIPEWAGAKLANASFLNYATSALKIMAAAGFDTLSLQTTGPQLAAAVNRLAPFINKSTAFDETRAIAKNDAKRDALWKALYYAWHYCAEVDEDDPVGAAALALKSVMTSYKGLYKHELTRETMEIQGLQRDLETSSSVNALKELGLYKIAGYLFDANTAVATATAKRESERGGRIAEKGGETTESLRKAIATLLLEAYRRINAVNALQSTDVTAKAAQDIVGIIAHYRLVAKKSTAKQDEPDVPDEGSDPSPETPDPSQEG